MTKQYELKLKGGGTVVWEGEDGINAARRYVDIKQGAVVIAWRDYPRYGIFTGSQNIIS